MTKLNKLLKRKRKMSPTKQTVAGVALFPQELSFTAGDFRQVYPVNEGNFDKALSQALDAYLIEKGAKPKQAIFALGGEFSHSALSVVRFNRPRPKESLRKKEYRKILKSLSPLAEENARKQVAPAYYENTPLTLTNRQIVQIKVDDFLVDDPTDNKGKRLEVAFSYSYAPTEIVSLAEKLARKEKLELLTITSYPQAVLSFASKEIRAKGDFLLFIETGGSFYLGVVFGNQLVISQSFPLGRETLQTNPSWIAIALEETLGNLPTVKVFPATVICVTGEESFPLLEEIIGTSAWEEKLPFARKPQAEFYSLNEARLFQQIARALAEDN